MKMLSTLWNRFEEGFIVLLLTIMTLVTFIYVLLNNFYAVFYYFGGIFESSASVSDFFYGIGDFILDMAQAMTWSNALTKALFAWLIFFGISYGVRIGGHIGVDALVKLTRAPIQRLLGLIACLACLGYAALITYGSFEWISTLLQAQIGADDLGQYGIKQWHIGMIVPFGFAMVFIRYLEILYRILRHGQIGLGLADEAADAAKLSATTTGQAS
ncbi:TRAP transporter small permease [Paenalcaligenes sp.]|uniref:TRAP transporter small permease n=1 Tax=Paenalcaligenes sp. TaxID=1966342 RepID=UPI002630333A|nr:TRAP transporter small permease [Paenalcaligenes sp.]